MYVLHVHLCVFAYVCVYNYMRNYYPFQQGKSSNRSWKSYFDYIIVDAKKPLFFEEGSMLREVDEATGSLRLGVFTGALQPGKVYNGGECEGIHMI